MTCTVYSYKGKVFNVEPPTFVELEVTQTDPGFKGDTATNVTKPAILETGCEVKVPLFINPGDRIRIDTRVGEYLEPRKISVIKRRIIWTFLKKLLTSRD